MIDRANPALRATDQVLNILAQQNQQLASLASNGDAVLEPLARNRAHITGFFHNAAISGEATAERSADLEESLRKFPATLHQIRLTMAKLQDFTDQGTPLFTDLNRRRPASARRPSTCPPSPARGSPPCRASATPPRRPGRSSSPPTGCSPTSPRTANAVGADRPELLGFPQTPSRRPRASST